MSLQAYLSNGFKVPSGVGQRMGMGVAATHLRIG